jgi:thioredoxin reductase (NADPH)
MNPDNFDLVIVGGGPAGLSAGQFAKKSALKTILVERSHLGGQVAHTTIADGYTAALAAADYIQMRDCRGGM